MKKKEVKIAKNIKVKPSVEKKMRKRPGGSNVGKYKTVTKKSFAGPKGGAPEGSFPINTLARARNALARSHFAPDPAGIRSAVYDKYPQLKKRKEKRDGKK